MKLSKIQVTNFRSIEDSGEFEIGGLTCLVGKNEAGKTAILRAIHGLSPLNPFSYDKTRDYPRRHLAKFDERHSGGESPVTSAEWTLDDSDVAVIEAALGTGVLTSRKVVVTSYIGRTGTTWALPCNEKACIAHFETKHGLSAKDKTPLKGAVKTKEAVAALSALAERTEAQEGMLKSLSALREGSAELAMLDLLSKRKPKFFYTSHFERMSGEVSLNQLAADVQQKKVSPSDQIFLDFLEYAGTNIDELRAAKKYEDLVAQCEGASNDITDEIFEFWSQNEALAVKIELGEGRAEDPPPFNAGTVAKVRIENRNHRASVPLSERSAGFVWFFSFLSQFKQLKKTAGSAILLLDEPGLTLHGKAQADLLRYIEERLLPEHQVIYSTHSPFMVPSQRLADVRVVEDVVTYADPRRPVVKGTKVSADVLSVDKDTLFPLQAHLGYEITQSLFVGKHCLLVEGPSDVVFLQVMSQALKSRGRAHLDSRWTICPTGGLDKVSSFASLFSGNNLNIAVLCDYGTGDKRAVERLKQGQILKSGRVLTAADFSGKQESDIEDLLDDTLYCKIVNQAFGLKDNDVITKERLAEQTATVRIVKQVEAIFKTMPVETPEFNHYTPAEWLMRNPQVLDADTADIASSLDKFEAAFKAANAFL